MATTSPVQVASKRFITIEDTLRFKLANAPQLAPDGNHVVCTLTTIDEAANRYHTNLWIVPVPGPAIDGAARQLTTAPGRDTDPRWSPDGRHIAFVSDREGTKRVWVIAADGGEARPVTSGALLPAELAWSPDGEWIAFAGKPEPPERRDQSDVRVITRLHYKQDGEGFWDGRWKQIFVVRATGAELRQVTQGDYDHVSPAWSPDGTLLAYTGNASPDADLVEAGDVWVIRVDGGAPPRCLTRTIGPAKSPAWSPDGARIAYLGHDNACGGATNDRVWIVPAAGGAPVCLTPGYDGSIGPHLGAGVRSQPAPGGLSWSPDGTRIYFLTTEGGTGQIASVSAADGAVRTETHGDHDLIGCSLDREGRRVACIVCDPLTPGEVGVADLRASSAPAAGSAARAGDTAAFRRITAWNEPLLHALSLVSPQRFAYTTPDGYTVEGWVMKPPHARSKVPAVLMIHGGPHGAYGNTFSYQFQLLCAAGYGVIYTNPRGSHGYGQAFLAATHHDWGGGDYEDLMGALDRALALHKWIDPDRLGVCGGSYGGYMTNWMLGHTQRFRAGVTLRSTCNRYSQWGTGDIAYHGGRWEWPGAPWESPDFYLERSPITYVRQMKTPLLILHGENDYRCPIEQAEQLFVALKRQGTPTLFVRFPGESHALSSSGQPRHRVEELRHLLSWFHTYLDKE